MRRNQPLQKTMTPTEARAWNNAIQAAMLALCIKSRTFRGSPEDDPCLGCLHWDDREDCEMKILKNLKVQVPEEQRAIRSS